jgi:hypothetical protein
MKRFLGAIAFASLLVLVPTTAVQARQPVRQPAPDLEFSVDAGDFCPFAVTAETLVNREKQLIFLDEADNPVKIIITGTLIVRITNDDSEASVVRNISGPAVLSFHEDGSLTVKLTGSSLLGLFPTDAGGPTLKATHGLVVLQVGTAGTVTDTSIRGHVEDMCQTLA